MDPEQAGSEQANSAQAAGAEQEAEPRHGQGGDKLKHQAATGKGQQHERHGNLADPELPPISEGQAADQRVDRIAEVQRKEENLQPTPGAIDQVRDGDEVHPQKGHARPAALQIVARRVAVKIADHIPERHQPEEDKEQLEPGQLLNPARPTVAVNRLEQDPEKNEGKDHFADRHLAHDGKREGGEKSGQRA